MLAPHIATIEFHRLSKLCSTPFSLVLSPHNIAEWAPSGPLQLLPTPSTFRPPWSILPPMPPSSWLPHSRVFLASPTAGHLPQSTSCAAYPSTCDPGAAVQNPVFCFSFWFICHRARSSRSFYYQSSSFSRSISPSAVQPSFSFSCSSFSLSSFNRSFN